MLPVFGRTALLAALILLSLPLVSPAADLKPVPKTGVCPPGYYNSGNFCVPNTVNIRSPLLEREESTGHTRRIFQPPICLTP